MTTKIELKENNSPRDIALKINEVYNLSSNEREEIVNEVHELLSLVYDGNSFRQWIENTCWHDEIVNTQMFKISGSFNESLMNELITKLTID